MGKIRSVYLAGNIGSLVVEPDTAVKFAVAAALLGELGLKVFNPARGQGKASAGAVHGTNEIVHRDEHDIDQADMLIAMMSIPEEGKISIGTPMEIYRAREIVKIPVIVVTDSEVIANHYWIKAKATKVVPTFTMALEYIKDWYLDGGAEL